MPPRPALSPPLLAALLLAACAGVPEQEARETGLRDALLNMQASLAAAAGAPAVPRTAAAEPVGEGSAPLPGAAAPRRPTASLVAAGPRPLAGRAPAVPDVTAGPVGADAVAPRAVPAPMASADPHLLESTAAAEAAALRRPAGGGVPLAAEQLLGRTPDLVRLWLGEPALRRPEGGAAEIWLYASEACALDLVLYRDRAGRMRVGFAAARARGEPQRGATEAECLRAIAAAPPARPAT